MPYNGRIHFEEVAHMAALFADHLRDRREQIDSALALYASMPAVEDELARATYLHEHLEENRKYFETRVGRVAAFLPRNQLLYATTYMGVVPALMSAECHVRPPESAHPAYRRLIQAVDFAGFFPNLHFFVGRRTDFVTGNARTADVVIFTGTYPNGEAVRKQLRSDAMFLFSGSGHNPVIVRQDADVDQAAEAIIRLCYHNQGQDCSAPNAILVHRSIFPALFDELFRRTLWVEAAMKSGRHPQNMIAPNTDGPHLVATAEAFLRLRPYLVHGGSLEVKSQLIYPTIFRKPLAAGPHLTEFFAPVIMLQDYDHEAELRQYFGHRRYRPNAMYVMVFGTDPRIDAVADIELHPPDTVLHNRDLHLEETGTRPYGGYGPEASFIHFAGSKRPSPILPQREIYRYAVGIQGMESGNQREPRSRSRTARDTELDKVRKLSGLGVRCYTPHFVPSTNSGALVQRYENLVNGESTTCRVTVAGRILACRNSGMFLDLWDASGKIQVLCHSSQLRARDVELLKLVSPGDLLGVTGTVRRTQRGELTIEAEELALLAKGLLPTSDRALGAAVLRGQLNRQAVDGKRRLLIHTQALAAVRQVMHSQMFEDAAGWALEPGQAVVPGAQMESGRPPWFSSLLANGLTDRLYRVHERVQASDSQPDSVLMVEAAQAFAGWRDMMALTERLIGSAARRLTQVGLLAKGTGGPGRAFDSQPVLAVIEQETGVSYSGIETDEEARQMARLLGCEIAGHPSWGRCVALVFLRKVAPRLRSPIQVTHLPRDISPWAVADSDDPRLAESYLTLERGQVIASGFTLLNDPFELARLAASRDRAEPEADMAEDEEALTAALERGMPPSAIMRTTVAPFELAEGQPRADRLALVSIEG